MSTLQPTATQVFTLVVDYARSVKDGIAAGKYDYKNEDITEKNFPPAEHEQGKKEQTFTLYHFNKDVGSDYAIAEMDKDGKLNFVQKVAAGEAVDVKTIAAKRFIAVFPDKPAAFRQVRRVLRRAGDFCSTYGVTKQARPGYWRNKWSGKSSRAILPAWSLRNTTISRRSRPTSPRQGLFP